MSLQELNVPSRDTPREFIVSAELYVPTTAAIGLRKPPVSRRKDNGKSVEDAPRKVKEKSSWISLSRSSPGSVQWRPATCKILDEDDSCLLNIYVDETILYQTVYLHMLNHTDIRYADPSLFLRKNCVGISSVVGGQRWSSGPGTEPIYLHFDDADVCNTWLVLLRSYARPEIYGQPFVPSDGGLYRMWRQVELSIMQGRNLGNHKPLMDSNTNSSTLYEDARSEADPVDIDIFCEIHVNDNICGRTTVKKGIGSPDWHESFSFSDLPPFEALEVILWKEKRLAKPVLLGSVRIALANFRRSEDVEGWFPVTQSNGGMTGMQVGEIRMKLKVYEEIILPHSSYSGMLTVLHARNVLEWMNDFERKLQLRTLSDQLMFIAIAKNVLVEHIIEYADREVDGTPGSHNTLFRGNTIFSKSMELAMAFYGRTFLEASIGRIIRQICSDRVAIEVDPDRSGKSQKDLERGVEQLVEWCQTVWNSIYARRDDCPHEIRRLFGHVRKLVEERYKMKDGEDAQNKELPWQSVSAFCFLRFIVPAILHPHLFGLTPGLPSTTVQRSLTLIAKVIQSLANLNVNVRKEEYMHGVKDFLRRNLPAMVDYILVVSTPLCDVHSPHSGHPAFSHQRLKVVNSLHQRGANTPILEREAIPLLPHVLDIPRHLACISSSLIRGARHINSKAKLVDKDHLSDLCSQCFQVEEIALQRVSQIATVGSPPIPVALKSDASQHVAQSQSPPSPTSPVSHARQRSFRPATAPSPFARSLARNPEPLPESPTLTNSSPQDLTSLRRGSVPELYSRTSPVPEERVSRTLGRPRFLRPKSVSADSLSNLANCSADVHPIHSMASRDLSSQGLSDEGSKRMKNIFTGLIRR